MKPLTQTSVGLKGNCWQTAVACLLDLDPDVMPQQVDYDRVTKLEDGTFQHDTGYSGVLSAYLREHHGLGYWELHAPSSFVPALFHMKEPGYHLLTGRTKRSQELGGIRHVVVARHGEMIWDPHPSHAGLTEDIRYAFLVPFPESWRSVLDQKCVCPKCAPKTTVAI